MQSLTGEAYVARYGHEWNVPEKALEYVQRTDRDEQQRAEAFKVMVSLIPFDPASPFRVLDIGAGQGTVAALVLDAFPNAHAVGLDVSEPMREIASRRMAPYGERFRYHLGDFVDGDLPGDLDGPFDVAVSSRAIHHLPPAKKQLLYRSIYASLNPGGCFFNLDGVLPGEDYLRARYREAGRFLRGEPIERDAVRGTRPPSLGHYWDSLEDHLRFLHEAGFETVDCFWKRLGMTLLGGYRRAYVSS